jgi:tetratricopeptide (TPR) repeat protein
MNPDDPLPPEVSVSIGDDAPSSTPADALTRLLEELARTPDAQTADAWQKKLLPGEIVGRFELVREVGRGGFGVVYEARDLQLGRPVAFKALRPGRALSAAQVGGLRREAEAAAQLNHPNVVTVHDFGSCPAGPFLILELLRGAPLSQRLETGPLPPREAVRIGTDVARALVHAHAAGVIHRDLKPGNVFLCGDGKVKVLDFGLANLLGTRGARGGTPGYMAPEQCRGEGEGERTDLFGLGVLLYRMLTAQMPFEVKNGRSAVLDEGPSPEPRAKHIPPRLSALVAKLLARDPAHRPASALDVLDELTRIGWALDPLALARRHRRRLVATALVVLAAAGGTAAGLWMRRASARALAHVTVAVADFVNETGEPDLEGLSGMLITSLEQSKKLTVLTRSRMRDELRQMGRGDAPRIDEALAREIGRRLGTKALLLASIKRFDTAYAVEMRALDPAEDRYLFTVSERAASKSQVPDLLDRVSTRARRELYEAAEDVGASRVRVGEVFTRNFEAYRHYFLGLECIDRPSQVGFLWQACADHFRHAIAADPGFSLAHYQLAYLSGMELNFDKETRSHVQAAMAHAETAPLKERLLILAWKAHVESRDDEAMAKYRELLERFPDDKHALYLTGDLFHHQGDNERAIPFMMKALQIDPSFEGALDHLAMELVATDRGEELAEYARRWQGMPPTPATLHALARARFGLGDPAGALAAARRYVAIGAGTQGQRDVASVLFSSGDYRGAERELRAAIAAGNRDDFLPFELVYTLFAQGRTREALAVLDELEPRLRASGEPPTTYQYCRAVLLAAAGARALAWDASRATLELDPALGAELAVDLALQGDVEHADVLAARLPSGSPRHELWQAVSAWKKGDVAGARSRLRSLDRLDPVPERAPMPSYILAEIAAAAGDHADAIAAVRRYRHFWAAGLRNGWTSPRSMVLLAASQLQLGQVDDARRTLDSFHAQWASADPDNPLLQQAKAVQEKLATYPVRGSPR